MSYEKHFIYITKAAALASNIYRWCKEKELWGDNIIYFNGKAWTNLEEWAGVKGKYIAPDLYEYEDKDPRDYFEYVREPNILSMSFEGPLNHVLNAYVPGWVKLEEEFAALFEKYGLYYEMGHAWNLSAYEV